MPPLEPMLATPTDIEIARTRQANWFMEEKLDGFRCIITRHHGDNTTLTSRSGKSFTEKVPLLTKLLTETLPPRTVLDCELGYPSEANTDIIDFNTTARVLGSGPVVAIWKQQELASTGRHLIPYVFDVLYWENQNLLGEPLWERRTWLARVRSQGVCYPVHTYDKFHENIYDSYVLSGGEGVMLKNPNAHYHPGKRPSQVWVKLKKFETDDAYATGQVLMGKGKYEGQVGAMYFMTDGGGTGKCSGMDDLTRQHITHMHFRRQLEGKAFEVKWYGKVGKDQGGLRHPQFVRWRPDKDKTSSS
jgi:ATP-dependent DNA ligase